MTLAHELCNADPEVAQAQRLQAAGDKTGDRLVDWLERKHAHMRSLKTEGFHDYQYFEMVRAHLERSPQRNRLLPLYALTLALQARRIVEFGSSLTYYPEGYRDQWDATSETSEGFLSTRIFLAACRVLRGLGIESSLTSVDIRPLAEAPGSLTLLHDLDLAQYWVNATGTPSDAWLAAEATRANERGWAPIDLAYVDSNHTYAQVKLEIEGVLPFMADRAVIIVDNCYTVAYETGLEWCPDETPEGIQRGGEYGAILEFIEAHPEWQAEWSSDPHDYMTLTRVPPRRHKSWLEKLVA